MGFMFFNIYNKIKNIMTMKQFVIAMERNEKLENLGI